jgi:hypothetical protein
MSFNIVINPLPVVDVLPNVVECSSYILPVITNGNYYTGSNGTGTLHAGDLIEKVEPIIFLAVLIQRPVPNNLASQSP